MAANPIVHPPAAVELTPSEFSAECWRRAEAYIDGILSGATPAGKLERQAVERFSRDAQDDRFEFKADQVDRVFRFFSLLRHHKTRQWSGRQFIPSDWQCFILAAIFGLYDREQQLRVVRIAYIQIARKNGKTTFAAGVALYLLLYDDEDGAEIYSAATKRDQAKIVWLDALQMIRRSPRLLSMVEIRAGVLNISVSGSGSKLEPVASDAGKLDGLNPHGNIVDELHAHKSSDLWNVLLMGMGARLQPLQMAITTAGSELDSVCYEQREYALKVLDGTFEDPAFFAFVCEMEEDDDWQDERNWRKGNPNLGISVIESELRAAARRAAAMPADQNEFQTKRLNRWCSQETRWIPMEAWRALPKGDVPLLGRRCFGGLDLSSTQDFTAFVLVFPPDRECPIWRLEPRFWYPEERMRDQSLGQFRRQLETWHKHGWLIATPGNVVDHDFIRTEVGHLGQIYEIQEIGYDPYNATQIVVQLETDGFKMVKMRQGVQTLHAPCKEFEKLITAGQLNPSASPILTWMASNVSVIRDSNGNMKPNRENKRLKIDGIVATIMGLGRAIATDPEGDRSKYESGGLLSVGA